MVFKNFCDDLAEYHTRNSPIESARRHLRGRMKDDIDRVMRDIHHGITPNLPLPSVLSGEQDEGKGHDGVPGSQKRRSQEEEEKKPPSWWSKNPESIDAWGIPDDKNMRDLFTRSTSQGKENIKLFPHVKHHNPTVTGKKPLCIKYQCKGKCRVGCTQSHVKPSSLSAEVKTKISDVFKKAYA
jgi:hypothetical protein